MKNLIIIILLSYKLLAFAGNESPRTVFNLNGIWQFDQTLNAFPPTTFTRTIPVPGLIHLATPKIDDYSKFFKKAEQVEAKMASACVCTCSDFYQPEG